MPGVVSDAAVAAAAADAAAAKPSQAEKDLRGHHQQGQDCVARQ